MDTKVNSDFNHSWHVALNRNVIDRGHWPDWHWMYGAKLMAQELPRLVALFQQERLGLLPQTHRQCSHSPGAPVEDNHLTCCLGKDCRTCPMLQVFDGHLTDMELDTARAWTCATHIVQECARRHVDTSEGYILTVDDRMFWDTTYRYMAMSEEEG